MNPVDEVLDHELLAVDHRGRWCACGEPFTPEHLYDVAAALLNAAPIGRDRRNERLACARRVLAEQAADEDALAACLEQVGITDLTDRAVWLDQHRCYPRRYTPAGERIRA